MSDNEFVLYLFSLIVVGGTVLLACATAIRCFEIKYDSSDKTKELQAKVEELHKKLDGVDAEAVKDLTAEVKTLRNHYGLTARK